MNPQQPGGFAFPASGVPGQQTFHGTVPLHTEIPTQQNTYPNIQPPRGQGFESQPQWNSFQNQTHAPCIPMQGNVPYG